MPEFRYQGVALSGRLAQGVISADNMRVAKKRIQEIAQARKIRLTNIQKRSNFLWEVRRGREVIKGQQKAYSKEDVERALQKMGYEVIRVQKDLLDFLNPKPPEAEVVSFIRISADLLRENMPYGEVLQLVIEDTSNKALRNVLKEIDADMKSGKEGAEVFLKQERALGKFTAHMLGVASTSGNAVDIYESTAKFMERTQQFKKDMKSALLMPIVIVVVMALAVAFYIAYIFPKTAEMFLRFGIDLQNQAPMTYYTLMLSDWLKGNIWWLLIALIVPALALVRALTTPKGQYIKDRLILKIPVVGSLLHKMSIEIFCRVFYSLYSGAGENIEVIRSASEACRNKYMEQQIKTVAIPTMVKEGTGIAEAFTMTDVFTENALSRFRSGSETGAVREAALQLANYYEKETGYKLRSVIDMVNLLISLFIMLVMIGLTVVSSETAVIKPKNPLMR